jgi:hypothetical protein
MEYFVPFEMLDDIDPTAMTTIGFDVTVVDNDEEDTGSRNRMVWANTGITDESWNNCDDVGLITFITAFTEQDISVNTSFDFGQTFETHTSSHEILIRNLGTTTLSISDITSSNSSVFSVSETSFNVGPLGTYSLIVEFTPPAVSSYTGTLTITSNDPDEGTVIIDLSGEGIAPPIIEVTPLFFNVTAQCGETVSSTLTVENSGSGNLTAQIRARTNNNNYMSIDSDDPNGPDFTWFDISTLGTATNLSGDDNFVNVTLPFAFPFYGENKTSIKISTNGFITFGTNGTAFGNTSLPTSNTPNDMIAALWDDLNGTGQNYYYYDTDKNRFVIQYSNWSNLNGSGTYDFQIHLYPSGDIYIYYQNLSGNLNGATVGIENITGSDGLQIAYNSTYLHNDLAVLIYRNPEWLYLSQTSLIITEGNSTDINLDFISSGINAGTHIAEIIITSNDPNSPEILVPCTFTLQGETEISVSETAFTFGEIFVNGTKSDTVIIYNTGCDTLFISDIVSSEVAFTANLSDTAVLPFDSIEVIISYTPLSVSYFTGTLNIQNNDTDEPTLTINLTGTGLLSPEMVVDTDLLFHSVNSCNGLYNIQAGLGPSRPWIVEVARLDEGVVGAHGLGDRHCGPGAFHEMGNGVTDIPPWVLLSGHHM